MAYRGHRGRKQFLWCERVGAKETESMRKRAKERVSGYVLKNKFSLENKSNAMMLMTWKTLHHILMKDFDNNIIRTNPYK